MTQSEELVAIASSEYRLGVSTDGEPFAVPLAASPVVKMFAGRRSALRSELAARFLEEHGKPPSSNALTDAILGLEGLAWRCSPEELHLRLANYEGDIWLDLGDTSGRMVRIGSTGWSIEEWAPVLFKRTALTGALPQPSHGANLEDLQRLLHVDDEGWNLIHGWLVAAFFPEIPHAVLALTGEQGSGKTSAARMLVRLIDASAAPLRTRPRDITDYVVATSGSWVVGLDNLSSIPFWLSDAICRTVTGDGLVRRQLYTDNDVVVNSYRRVVLINGIDLGALRGDLVDRTAFVTLPRIDPGDRREDSEIERMYTAAHPALLGSLLDLVAAVLAARSRTRPTSLPRMADYARILATLDEVTGERTLEAFRNVEALAMRDAIEGDSVASAVLTWLTNRRHREWEGTATDLLKELTPDPAPKGWPPTAQHLSGRINRASASLRAAGVDVTYGRSNTVRTIRVANAAGDSPSPASRRDDDDDDDDEINLSSLQVQLDTAVANVLDVFSGADVLVDEDARRVIHGLPRIGGTPGVSEPNPEAVVVSSEPPYEQEVQLGLEELTAWNWAIDNPPGSRRSSLCRCGLDPRGWTRSGLPFCDHCRPMEQPPRD